MAITDEVTTAECSSSQRLTHSWVMYEHTGTDRLSYIFIVLHTSCCRTQWRNQKHLTIISNLAQGDSSDIKPVHSLHGNRQWWIVGY